MRLRVSFTSVWLTRSGLIVFTAICLTLLLSFATSKTHSQNTPLDYKNPKLSVDTRVADLLKRMTLEEKVAQLVCLWGQRPQAQAQTDFSTDRGDLSPEKAAQVMKYGIGQIGRQRERKGPR